MNARTTALSALIAIRRQNAWADGAIKEYTARDRLDRRDAALAASIFHYNEIPIPVLKRELKKRNINVRL